MEPCALSAADAARRIAAGELTSAALVESCLARIAERESSVLAWAALDPELALEQARARDREPPRGCLHGIPIGIKDIVDTADLPTGYGSAIYAGHRPRADAACVQLLRRAGCVILGKTATTEFAHNHPAPTRNPRHPAHTPGGSSSGSAAAVADYMVPLALGTQTGGSTMRPAAYCGVVGFKPTFNAINRAGVKAVAESLDTLGLFAREVEDVALLLEVLTGSAGVPREAGVAGLRIGLFQPPRWTEAEPHVRQAIEDAATRLASAGARVARFAVPRGFEALDAAQVAIMNYETARSLAWEAATHASLLSESLRPRLQEGWSMPRATYDDAQRAARVGRRAFTAAMEEVDVLVTLGASEEALPTLAKTGSSTFIRAFTLLGVPTLALPFGTGPSGLPIGVQIVGRPREDMRFLARCAAIARALGSAA